MKSIFSFFLALTIFSFPNHLTAQSQEYLKGYMITSTQDTIRGYIKDDRRINLADQFSFKSNPNTSAKTVSNSEAIGFFFEPGFYFDLIEVKNGKATEHKFLRKLVDGYTDLYHFPNGNYTDYVLIKGNYLAPPKTEEI